MKYFPSFFRTTIKKVGFSDMTLDVLGQCLSRKSSDIKVCPYHVDFLILCSAICVPLCYLEKEKRTGHSENFGPAVSHLCFAGFTEINHHRTSYTGKIRRLYQG